MENMTVMQALGSALLGLAVVFVALIALWLVVGMLAKALRSVVKTAPAAPAAASAAAAPAAAPGVAPGSAGEMKLFDVPDRDAALAMAIIADKLGKPLNELRFKSIKEVK